MWGLRRCSLSSAKVGALTAVWHRLGTRDGGGWGVYCLSVVNESGTLGVEEGDTGGGGHEHRRRRAGIGTANWTTPRCPRPPPPTPTSPRGRTTTATTAISAQSTSTATTAISRCYCFVPLALTRAPRAIDFRKLSEEGGRASCRGTVALAIASAAAPRSRSAIVRARAIALARA